MASNVQPIYTVPDIQWIGAIVTANNTKDLTSGTSYLAYTAGSDGAYLQELRIKADPANNTAATVVRVFINNGSTTGTATNSTLVGEITITARTATAVAALPDDVFPLGFGIKAGYKVYLTIGTAPGGSGQFSATVIAGTYTYA